MTPREFLKAYSFDARVLRGDFFSSRPLSVDEGDCVGVVLMNLGGPERLGDVEPFLYNLFMDPATVDLPVGGLLRHWTCRLMARIRAGSVRDHYESIGGGSPINRLTREQAYSLEHHLNTTFGEESGVTFRTYIGMRYWHPFCEEAALQMEEDGVDEVVLLPLYPQYSKSTTGSSLAYWHALDESDQIASWPTTAVQEYAANPKYVQALSERIDEALQRFPREAREDVHLLFSAHGTPMREMTDHGDPYCCLTHATVDRVMRHRGFDRAYHVAFQNKVGLSQGLSPSTSDTVAELAEAGVDAALVVPVSFVTDHVETSYQLDIAVREQADVLGIEQYEVTSGINSHPLFIEALAETTVAQLQLPADVDALRAASNGSTASYRIRPLDDLPRFPTTGRTTRCPNCRHLAEARCWNTAERHSADVFDDVSSGDGATDSPPPADVPSHVEQEETESA